MTMDTVIQFRGTIYEKGYGLIAQKVMRDRDLSPTAKSIYAYICSFASVGEDGERSAFPGVDLMMVELGIKTEDTYYKHRKQLLDKGYITIEKNRKSGKFDNNIYYVEAVPVPQNVDTEGIPPYPKKSSTVKSSTVKSGTNSTSLNSTSLNSTSLNSTSLNNKNTNTNTINDDDKRTSSPQVSHVDESIDLIISNFREATKDDLTERSFRAVIRKVTDKHNQGSIGKGKFRDYLATSLANKIYELELRKAKDRNKVELLASKQQLITERTERLQETPINTNLPFYNWLE